MNDKLNTDERDMTLTNVNSDNSRLGENSMPHCDPSMATYQSEKQLDNQSSTDVKENGYTVPDDSVHLCRLRAKITRTKPCKRDREPSRIRYKKVMSLFHKGKIIRKHIMYYLKRNIPKSSVLRNMSSPIFRNFIALRMSKSRRQRIRKLTKSLTLLNGECCCYLLKIRTAKHKKTSATLLCFQGQSLTEDSIQGNKQSSRKYCASRDSLLLSGDIQLNPGPATHESITNSSLKQSPMTLLQNRLAQQGLKALECSSDGSCFFSSVSHQLYNDPSYHMRIRAAAVEYMRNHPERFIEHVTE